MSSWVVDETVGAIRVDWRRRPGTPFFKWVPAPFGITRKCSGCLRRSTAVALVRGWGSGALVADACLRCWTDRRPELVAAVSRLVAEVVRVNDLPYPLSPELALTVLAELSEAELAAGPR